MTDPTPKPQTADDPIKADELPRAANALLNTLWQLCYSGVRTHEENWVEMDRRFPQARWVHDAIKAGKPSVNSDGEPTAWLTKIYSKDGSLLHTQLDFVKPRPGWKEKVEFIPLYAAASEGKS